MPSRTPNQKFIFFLEADIFRGKVEGGKAETLWTQHFHEIDQYALFLHRKGRRPLFDIYPCFQPFNEATKAFFPFINTLQSRLQPGDTILNLWDRSGFFAGLLAGLFPEQQIITTWTGNQDMLGYKGFYHWFGNRPRHQILFCDLNKPLPIQENTISLVIGLDSFHRFDQSLLMRELLRITHDDAAIIFPHVHLTNSEPEPYFDRGCKQLHGMEYDAFFQRMAQHTSRKGYIFGEATMFWENDVKKNPEIPLSHTPNTSDYNALLAILPSDWKVPLAAFGTESIADVATCRILVNHILQIDLHQGRVFVDRDKMEKGVGHLLDRHPIYVERLKEAGDYPLSEQMCRVLYLAMQGHTVQEISTLTQLDLQFIIDDLSDLEQRGIAQVLPLSEEAFRLQQFISTQEYLFPHSSQHLQLLWQQAQRLYKDQPLLIDGKDESIFTFEEADEVVEMVCRRLQEVGLSKGDHIILYGDPSCRSVAYLLGVYAIGACGDPHSSTYGPPFAEAYSASRFGRLGIL